MHNSFARVSKPSLCPHFLHLPLDCSLLLSSPGFPARTRESSTATSALGQVWIMCVSRQDLALQRFLNLCLSLSLSLLNVPPHLAYSSISKSESTLDLKFKVVTEMCGRGQAC